MHRVKEIVTFIDDVNAARRSVFGALVTRGEERGRDADWAGRFFRRTVRSPNEPKAGEPEKTPQQLAEGRRHGQMSAHDDSMHDCTASPSLKPLGYICAHAKTSPPAVTHVTSW